MNRSVAKIISKFELIKHYRLYCCKPPCSSPSSPTTPMTTPSSTAAKPLEGEEKKKKKRQFFTKKSILPHGIQTVEDAKIFSKELLPGERKLIFDTLRKITADQYNEHKKVTTTEIHHEDLKRLWYLNFIPMFVFGLLDEACLIIGGDAINNFFSVYNGMSMLASTAVANVMCNLILQIPAENCARFLGFIKPTLSSDQMNTIDYRNVIGLWLGLLLGMIPLVFVDDLIDSRSDIKPKNNWIASLDISFRQQKYNEYIDLNEDRIESSGAKCPGKSYDFHASDVD